jgi:hypothetical protein
MRITQIEGASPSRRQRVPEALLDEIRAATVVDHGDVIHLELRRMPPTTYGRLKPILAEAGFVWNSGLGTHVGSDADLEAFEQIRDTGFYYDSKRDLEFFATAPAAAATLANLLASEVGRRDAPRILEPSAGDGSLVQAILAAMPSATVKAVECDARRAQIMRARFAGDSRVSIVESDFLAFSEDGWDGVLMNPPFDHALAHVRHAYDLVRPIGHIIGIASTERVCDRELVNWFNDRDAWLDPTEPGTFVDTAFQASFFGLVRQTSWLERMRTALAPYHSIGEVQVRRLTEISRDLHRLSEAWCNGEYDDEDVYDAKHDELLKDARRLVAPEAIVPIAAGDPRAGHGLRLQLPSGFTNDWGQTGVIVPNALPVKYAVHAAARAAAVAVDQLSLLDLTA